METRTDTKRNPARLVKPGDILREELEERGWSQHEFADIIGKPYQAVSEIINGKKEITPDSAIRFAEALGTSPELWLNMEGSYRLAMAARGRHDDSVSRTASLYEAVPVRELIKKGWIKSRANVDDLERELLSFLGISQLDQMERIAAQFRVSQSRSPKPKSLICWLRRAEMIAHEAQAKAYSREMLLGAIPDIPKLSRDPGQAELVGRRLSELGVRLVIVPHLDKTYVDGCAFWLDEATPVVALSLRFHRLDNFWFTLMHELAHIVLHSANGTVPFVDEELERQAGNRYESQANEQARDWLIPKSEYKRFLRANRSRYTARSVQNFAYELGIAPGIVVGRLHFDLHVPYGNMRGLIPKIT